MAQLIARRRSSLQDGTRHNLPRAAITTLCWTLLILVLLVKPLSGADCQVRLVGGMPALIIDGQPHSGFCYSTYDTSAENLERRVRQFAEAGCDIFNFVVELSGYGYSPPLWPREDTWDFSPLDDRARRILAAAPQGYLLPRIYIDAPEWWRAKYPEEAMVLDDGSTSFGQKLFALSRPGDFPSLASSRWRADMQQALRRIIDHVQQSDYADRVIGYQISGQKTEEWYHWSMNCERLGDYSPSMQQAFRKWLFNRYGTDHQLQQVWHRDDVSLDTACIPEAERRIGDRERTFRDPHREQDVIDFHMFWSDIMAETIALFAQTVKEATCGTKVVGAFYAYTFEFVDLAEDAGHLGLGTLLQSPHIDFIMAPSSYFNRNLPGMPFFRPPTLSLARYGKLFWNDFDQVSFKYFEKLKADPQLKTWEWQMGLTRTPEEFVWMNRREIGMTLTSAVQTAHFDIHGGYYEDPLIMDAVAELGRLRAESMHQPDRTSVAEVLALVDERSAHYLRFRNPPEIPGTFLRKLLSAQIAELGCVAPYDTALLSDLEQIDTARYKLILVLNAFALDTGQRELIRQRLASGGRTVLWYYAPGYFGEHDHGTDNVTRLTGIQVARGNENSTQAAITLVGDLEGMSGDLALLSADKFVVCDPNCELLAVLADDPSRGILAKRVLQDWTSIYSATAPLPAPLLKRLAADAGVHIYDHDPTHLVFANRHLLTLCGNATGGDATIHLPAPRTVVDQASGVTVGEKTQQFTTTLRPKEVRLFLLQEPE